jgi:capsular exopolysaccharide synthesis family protein
MSTSLTPSTPPSTLTPRTQPAHFPAPAREEGGLEWARYIAAIRRYKWMIAAIVVGGTALGVLATRFIRPVYEVRATIWISTPSDDRGPIRADHLLASSSWLELFRSATVTDPVVSRLALYLSLGEARDSIAFTGFSPGPRFRPGEYKLTIDQSGRRYTLLTKDGARIETGAIGDSIGTRLGFLWRPEASSMPGGRTIAFTLVTPREASRDLVNRLEATMPRQSDGQASSFLRLTLTGENSVQTAHVLNEWMGEFLAVAQRLKKRNLVELAGVLEEQLRYAQGQLRDAEIRLEDFRVTTITMPSEGTPVTGGLEQTRDPVFSNFFEQKVQYDEVRRDREALERIISQAGAGSITPESFYSIPIVLQSAQNLRAALEELSSREAALRSARLVYTDEHRTVRELQQELETLRGQTIPQVATAVLAQLRGREQELERRIGTAAREMRDIPTRTIEEMRLRRQVAVRENLYTTLQSRYEEARLGEASAIPDVQLLDSAVAPQRPTGDAAPLAVVVALLASAGLAVVLAIVLDRIDTRVRYSEQVTQDLGLDILGAVPTITRTKPGAPDPEEASQVVEAFRTIRLSLTHGLGFPTPFILAVSSPNPGDGKSLVSSNLALSFAEAGFRTLLIDGDVRRGVLHTMFGVPRRPGLVDALLGNADGDDDIVRPTTHAHLTLLPSGSRNQRAPELLASRSMASLVDRLKSRYEVVVIDTAPLSAGIDAFALGSAAGNLLVVIRTGETDRKLAEAKLSVVDRLPIHLVGAVLNAFTSDSAYRYYAYDTEYLPDEDEPVGAIGAAGD